MNILAGDITVQAGNGGSGLNAAAGAGGLISDTPTINVGGQTLPTILEADFVLTIKRRHRRVRHRNGPRRDRGGQAGR